MILVLILKFIFFTITTISNIITRLVFGVAAHAVVLIIQGLKMPGEAIQGALEQLAEAIKACFECLLSVLLDIIGSVISSVFDALKEAAVESVVSGSSIVAGLADKTRETVQALLTDSLPDIFDGFSDMVSTIVKDLWDNYVHALEHVSENA